MPGKKRKKKEEFIVRESSERYIPDEEVISIIEKRLPELIEKKPLLKDRIREMFRDVFAEKKDIVQILNELRLQREDSNRRFEEILKELRQSREDTNKKFEASDKRFDALLKEFQQHREDTNKRFEVIAEELRQHREETNKRFEESDRRFEALLKEFQQYREDTNKRFEVIEKRLEEQGEIIKEHSRCIMELQKAVMELQRSVSVLGDSVMELQRAVSAIGERWGTMAEDAFRNTLIGIVSKKLDIKEIKKWRVYDEEGIVYNEPCWVEADIVIKNEKHILIEIKASPSRGDIAAFFRVGRLYEKKEGVKPHLSMLAVFIREKDRKFAEKLGIEVFSSEEK